jgi:alpha-glucoside transport system substrate-binding protein
MRQQRGRTQAVAMTAALLVGLVSCTRSSDAADRPVVTVFGSFTDRDADAFIASMAAFEEESGIDVRYVGSSRFEGDLLERSRRGDAPDLALIPQPGLLASLAEDGLARPYDGDLADAARRDVDPRLVQLATIGGDVYGSWYSVTPKSLIWYSPAQFTARGLEPPTTWDGLLALTDEIAASGTTPWCLGVRDGGATGWVATDWVEDLLLRFAGPDAYDQWIDHDLPFTDPVVAEAVDRFGSIALDSRRVYGGNRAAVEFTVQDAARQLLGSSPKCLLNRQASFLTDYLDGPVDVAPDGDLWVFPFPGPAESASTMIVGGTVTARFNDRPEVRRLAEYLTTPAAAAERVRLGGFVSALESVDTDAYPAALNRTVVQWARDAEVLRFDASDLMPPEVGVDAFWTAMTVWLSGGRLSTALATIDSAWPEALVPTPRGSSDGG